MSWQTRGRGLREFSVWLMTASLSIVAVWSHFMARGESDERSPGWAMLALPVGLVRKGCLLDGWDGLSACGEGFTRPADPGMPGESIPPVDQPATVPAAFPVQLFGVVDVDGTRLYYFFDTRLKRWFRLAPGESDDKSAVFLENTPTGDIPVLRDTQSGRRYGIAGRQRLIPLEEEN